MSRVAILLALLIGTVLVAFLVLIAVSELATWRRGATTGWVFIAKDGRIAISGPFEEVQPFRGGLAAVKKGGQWGFIDATGREVLPFRFASVGSFSPEGLAPATGAGGWGYIRRDGNWAISPR